MKTSIDFDSILFKLLNDSDLKSATGLTGGIYPQDDRPDNSILEDVLLNTISSEQDALPQIASSNVNIYVADTDKTINGAKQKKTNRTRLKVLTAKVMDILRNAEIDGMKIVPTGQTILPESSIKQHYANIRIDWNVLID